MFQVFSQRFSKFEAFQQSPHFGLPKLNPREIDTLKWLASGSTLQEIADFRIHRSIDTINVYIRNLKRKLHTRNQPQLIAKAMLLGII